MTWSTITSAFISLALALMACAPQPCAPVVLGDAVPGIVDSTVALVADLEDGGTAPVCTGVWVSAWHIATAGHCAEALAKMRAGVDDDSPDIDPMGAIVEYATRAETRGFREKPVTRHTSQVVAYDAAHDVAILSAMSDAPTHRKAAMVLGPLPLGTPLHLVGHAQGYLWTYMRGYACQTWPEIPGVGKDGPWLQVTAPVAHGMSGSGAWTEDGRLVGLLSFYSSRTASTSFYIPSTTVANLLAQVSTPR